MISNPVTGKARTNYYVLLFENDLFVICCILYHPLAFIYICIYTDTVM